MFTASLRDVGPASIFSLIMGRPSRACSASRLLSRSAWLRSPNNLARLNAKCVDALDELRKLFEAYLVVHLPSICSEPQR